MAVCVSEGADNGRLKHSENDKSEHVLYGSTLRYRRRGGSASIFG
jgi:hypothetical protein